MSSPPPTSSQKSIETTVYADEDLADRIASNKVAKSDAAGKQKIDTTKSSATTGTGGTPKTGEKRQRSLTDMFTKVATPATKRLRVSVPIAGASSSSGGGEKAAPRLVNGIVPLNYVPFNAQAFTDGLSEEERRLLKLECETMGKSWLKVLTDEIRKPYFINLKKFLWEEGVREATDASTGSPKIFPPPKDIYAWSRYTPLGRVRVVIIGQDPYHGPGQAHGLCFSVRKGVPVPPSLKNIYKEVETDYPEFVPPKHGSLTNWAESGVLLINTSLTVRSGQAGSHAGKGWETFTDSVVTLIDKYGGASLSKADGGVGRGVVFLTWGAWAGKRVAKLSKKKHLILSSAHPSPLSAHRGFFGNAHFKKANDWLETKYGAEGKVDWCKLEE